MVTTARFARQCVSGLSLVLASFAIQAQDLPWHLGSMNSTTAAAPAAINTAGTKPGPHEVVVAVIDGGVLPNHPSLSGRLLPGYDMMSVRQGDK